MLYCYILGCGIACLIFTGISSMDTVDIKPVELVAKILLWPVALVRYLASPAMAARCGCTPHAEACLLPKSC